jgi:hypothetical protein
MNILFKNLVEGLVDGQITPQEFHNEIKKLDNFSDDLLSEIERQAKLKNVFALTNLIWAIPTSASTNFTVILCSLLENKKEGSYMEAIVDALIDAKDQKSISSLKKVLNHYEAGDDDFNFNRKVLWALERIGTIEAFEVIKLALNNENEFIREYAKEILERNNTVH